MEGLERIDELLKKYGNKTTFELLEMLDAAMADTVRLDRLQSLLEAGSVQIEPGTPIRQRLDEAGAYMKGVKTTNDS